MQTTHQQQNSESQIGICENIQRPKQYGQRKNLLLEYDPKYTGSSVELDGACVMA